MVQEKPHKRLEAWKKAVEWVIDVYKLTGRFPPQERYALADQMRRAAVSIPSNIAEGAARQTKKEFTQFLHMARGSLSELDTQVEIAGRLGYVPSESQGHLQSSCNTIDRLLNGLVKSMRTRSF